MATSHAPSNLQRVFNKVTILNTAFIASISAQPDFWLENLKALQQTYTNFATSNTTLITINVTLTEKISGLENAEKQFIETHEQLASTHKSATTSYNVLNQALKVHTIYKNQITKLIKQLCFTQSTSSINTSYTKLFSKYLDLEKFSGNCDQL